MSVNDVCAFIYIIYLIYWPKKKPLRDSVIANLQMEKLTLRDMKCLALLYTAREGNGEQSSDTQGSAFSRTHHICFQDSSQLADEQDFFPVCSWKAKQTPLPHEQQNLMGWGMGLTSVRRLWGRCSKDVYWIKIVHLFPQGSLATDFTNPESWT